MFKWQMVTQLLFVLYATLNIMQPFYSAINSLWLMDYFRHLNGCSSWYAAESQHIKYGGLGITSFIVHGE